MRKLILSALVLSTLTMCKKSEITNANEAIRSADSLVEHAAESIEKMDATADAAVDSINLKAKDLIRNKEEIEKAFNNSRKKIDSISENVEKFRKDIEDKKIVSNLDSIKNSIKKELPKTTKEVVTKIVYKDKPQQNNPPKPASITKKAYMEMNVDDIGTGKTMAQNQIRKYDGIIKTENLVTNDELQTYYITAKVALSNFDYLLEDLADLGTVKNKNIEINGSSYNENKMCDLEITMYGNRLQPSDSEKSKDFGSKSLDAISSGWHVIGSILLFLLPFWPLFLLGAIGYYFYKKKNSKSPTPPENKNHEDHQ